MGSTVAVAQSTGSHGNRKHVRRHFRAPCVARGVCQLLCSAPIRNVLVWMREVHFYLFLSHLSYGTDPEQQGCAGRGFLKTSKPF